MNAKPYFYYVYIITNTKKLSEETLIKIGLVRKGKRVTEEVKLKISKNNACFWKGKNMPEESKKKIDKNI